MPPGPGTGPGSAPRAAVRRGETPRPRVGIVAPRRDAARAQGWADRDDATSPPSAGRSPTSRRWPADPADDADEVKSDYLRMVGSWTSPIPDFMRLRGRKSKARPPAASSRARAPSAGLVARRLPERRARAEQAGRPPGRANWLAQAEGRPRPGPVVSVPPLSSRPSPARPPARPGRLGPTRTPAPCSRSSAPAAPRGLPVASLLDRWPASFDGDRRALAGLIVGLADAGSTSSRPARSRPGPSSSSRRSCRGSPTITTSPRRTRTPAEPRPPNREEVTPMRLSSPALLIVGLSVAAGLSRPLRACLWDNDTLEFESRGKLDVIRAITGRFDRNPLLYYEMGSPVGPAVESDPADLASYDDAGVASDRLGRGDEAIAWMDGRRRSSTTSNAGRGAPGESATTAIATWRTSARSGSTAGPGRGPTGADRPGRDGPRPHRRGPSPSTPTPTSAARPGSSRRCEAMIDLPKATDY